MKKKVGDIMPIATGHEREELQAELEVLFFFYSFNSHCFLTSLLNMLNLIFLFYQGKKLLDINYPVGPFGTKVCAFFLFGLLRFRYFIFFILEFCRW